MAMANLRAVGSTMFGGGDAIDEATGRTFSARVFVDSQRYRELDRKEQYYKCTHHNAKSFDFDGRILQARGSNIGYTQPFLSSEKASFYVPLRSRRPSAPYRLPKAIVNAFTNFVFGEGRFPNLLVRGDEDSQDFLQTCAKVGGLPMKAMRARTLGGSVGTVGMAWSFVDGKPRYSVHSGKNLYVHEWEDRNELVPSHVTECVQVANDEWDAEKKRVLRKYYWKRRDWTRDAEIMFKLAPVDPDKEPDWAQYVDTDRSCVHRDKNTHFVWIQNTPNEEDIDGAPDYDDEYEAFDELDIILSVMAKGAKLNLDPTLVLKEDALKVARMGVKKGSDQALVVDKEGGDAKYLELSGSSIDAGIKLFNELRKSILEVCECVIPDPDTIAAQGQSAAAQKMVFSRMLSKGGMMQEQYGAAIQRLCEPLLFIAQARVQVPAQQLDEDGNDVTPDQEEFRLPPRIDEQDELGDDGQPTGEKIATPVERHPGTGEDVDLEWPPRFPPTPTDQQAMITSLSTAVAAAPVMSQQTAVELSATAYGREPAEEWKRVQADTKKQQDQQAQMQADGNDAMGGKQAPPMHQVPPNAKPPGTPKPPGGGMNDDEPKDDEGGNP